MATASLHLNRINALAKSRVLTFKQIIVADDEWKSSFCSEFELL